MEPYLLSLFSALLLVVGGLVAAGWANISRRIAESESKNKRIIAAILKLNMRWYPDKSGEIAEIMTSLLENGKR